MQVAPTDLENLYLCAVLSCTDVGINLCTAAAISLDETILIGGDDMEAVQRLGFDDRDFITSYGPMFEHIGGTMYLNMLLTSADIDNDDRFAHIGDRLEADDYIWVSMQTYGLHPEDTFTIKGFLHAY
jgi:hypothetical protein